ncbi:MAG: hypothetical protein AAGK02_12440 [Pseudomonadota bacterium]
MTNLKKTIAKGTLGTVAAGAMALASANPAMARDRNDKIDAGDVIAGALIIGGIAAIASAASKDRDRHYRHDTRYRDRGDYRGYNNRGYYKNSRRGGSRVAVEKCVNAAERQARRFGGFRYADVTQIRDVDRTRNGYRVKGRIVVDGARGYGRNSYDRGRFTCWTDGYGRPQVDFKNVRGLR